MGTSSCILIYYEGKFCACQTYNWDGDIGGQGAYIFKFLSCPKRTKALKKGLKHITYVSQDQREDATQDINAMRDEGYLLEISSWESFCTEYTSDKPDCFDKIHKYIDACSGPAMLKLISAATAQKKVTLVHPAFLSTLEAAKKLKFVHSAFHPKSNIHDIDLEELNIEKLGINDIVMDDFDILDFDIVHPSFAYMIDLDQSTLKVYEGSYQPVCEYTFVELETFTEAEFMGRYYEEIGIKEGPNHRLMLAGPLCHDSHVKIALDLNMNFEFCSTVRGHPTHLVCTRGQYCKRKRRIKSIRYAKENRIPICAHGVLGTKGGKVDMQKHLLWHPNHGSK